MALVAARVEEELKAPMVNILGVRPLSSLLALLFYLLSPLLSSLFSRFSHLSSLLSPLPSLLFSL